MPGGLAGSTASRVHGVLRSGVRKIRVHRAPSTLQLEPLCQPVWHARYHILSLTNGDGFVHPAVGVFITPVQGPFGLAATWRKVPKKDSSRTCPCAPSVGDARQSLAVAFFVATVAATVCVRRQRRWL